MLEQDFGTISRIYPDAVRFQKYFIKKFHQDWGAKESAIELCIQIGHLAQAMIHQGRIDNYHEWQQPGRKTIKDIKDELCDCFLSVCSLNYFLSLDSVTVSFDEEEIPKEYKYNIMDLMILSSQLLDSVMIYKKIKPPFERDELDLIAVTWIRISRILLDISNRLDIGIEEEFNKMIKNTKISFGEEE